MTVHRSTAGGDAVMREGVEDKYAWSRPGVYPVASGVHRIPLPLPNDGLHAVNVYVVTDGDGLIVIDSGWALAEASTALRRGLDELGFPMTAIRRILVTHAHRNHYTHAVRLRAQYGIPVTLGIDDRPYLTAVRAGTGNAHRRAQLHRFGADALQTTHSMRETTSEERANWADPDEWLHVPVTIQLTERTLHAIPTPGHTRGHVIFADLDNGVLFAGDHILPSITPSIGFEPDPSPQPLRDYLDSLRLAAQLPEMTLLPGHGPIQQGFHDRVSQLLAHHNERLELARTAVADRASTVLHVAQQLPWTSRRRRFADLDVANQMLALIETAAHVDLLVALGDLAITDIDGVRRYDLPQAPQ
jgi:glyoxylase-like metal-dependent hydrolase (beta-lactamase superfamily II)